MGFIDSKPRSRPPSVTLRELFELIGSALRLVIVLVFFVLPPLLLLYAPYATGRFIGSVLRPEPEESPVQRAWAEHRRKEFLPPPVTVIEPEWEQTPQPELLIPDSAYGSGYGR